MRKLPQITFLLFVACPGLASGQIELMEYMDRVHSQPIRDAQRDRLDELSAANWQRQAERLRKAYRSIDRKQQELFNESNGLFGDIRKWKVGTFEFQAQLVDIGNGNVTVITEMGPVHVKLPQLSDHDKKYISLYRDWKKLGSGQREQWLADYHAEKELEKLESDFDQLNSGFDLIAVGETTLVELRRILGNRTKSVDIQKQPCIQWIARNPDTGEWATLTIEIRNSVADRATRIGFN